MSSSAEGWSDLEDDGAGSARSRSRSRGSAKAKASLECDGASDDDRDERTMAHGKMCRQAIEPPKPKAGHAWWQEPVYRSLQHLRQGLPRQQARPLVLHSGCSGVMAEKVILDELGAQIGVCVGADMKGASQSYVMDNVSGLTHFFSTIDELIAGCGQCLLKKKSCRLDRDQRPDIAVFGPPCQPFSTLRSKSGSSAKTGSTASHPSFRITMRKIPEYVQIYKPHVCIIEQVQSFAQMTNDGRVPAQDFIKDFGRAFSAVRAVELEAAVWVEMQRPRLYIAGFSEFVGGSAAADRWVSRLQELARA